MASTLLQLRTRITDWMATDANRMSAPIVDKIINLVIQDLARKADMRFFEKSDSVAVTATTRDYALPTGFARPHTLWYVSPASGSVVFLRHKNKETFDALYPVPQPDSLNSITEPLAYSVWGSVLSLAPTPQVSFSATFNFYRYLPDLVADGDTNDVLAFADDYVLWASLVLASKYMIEDQRLPLWLEAKEEAFRSLNINEISRRIAERPESTEPGFVGSTL